MTKKTSNYILIVLGILWLGVLGYKFYPANTNNEVAIPNPTTPKVTLAQKNKTGNKSNVTSTKNNISDSLILNFTDPFLKKYYYPPKKAQQTTVTNNNTAFTKPTTHNKPKSITKPTLIYKGVINGENNLAIINYKGKNLFVRKNDALDSVFIVDKVTDTAIFIKGGNAIFTYHR